MNKINKINVCCQKVLPLVYDESLSYYEVLCKVQQKLNELIKINNAVRDEAHKEYVEILETAEQVTEAVATATQARDEVLSLKQATEQYAHDVTTVYNQTVQAKNTAVESATSASQSASTASAKASIAQASATTATEKANIASQSATTATQKADSASQSATIATEKAEIAVTNAGIAKNNADKVIAAMSQVSGTANYYKGSTINKTVTTSEHEKLEASFTPVVRNNVLYTSVILKQTFTGVTTVPLPNIKYIYLNMAPVIEWLATKIANIDTANLPKISYCGSYKQSSNLDPYGLVTIASGSSSSPPNFPINLQIFSNRLRQLDITANRTEVIRYEVTIVQPLKFKGEES